MKTINKEKIKRTLEEFPGFYESGGFKYLHPDLIDMINNGDLVENAWHNDSCPCFTSNTLKGHDVFIEHAEKDKREYTDQKRFFVVAVDDMDRYNDELTTDCCVELIGFLKEMTTPIACDSCGVVFDYEKDEGHMGSDVCLCNACYLKGTK